MLDEAEARQRFARALALKVDMSTANTEFERRKLEFVKTAIPKARDLNHARKLCPAEMDRIDADFQEKARRWVERMSRFQAERDRVLLELAEEITPVRSEGVWSESRRFSSSDYLSQGYGCMSYAEGRAEIEAELIAVYDRIPVRITRIESDSRSLVTFVVEVEAAPLDVEVMARKEVSREEPYLVQFVRASWRRGLNPRVYLPWLPHGYEEKHRIGWQGQRT